MPEMNGFETMREVCKRWPKGHRPWIIALTANSMDANREQCLAAGMDDFLRKPVRFEELKKALEQARSFLEH